MAKWRAEVDRAKSARDGQPGGQRAHGSSLASAPKPPPRAPAVLVDSTAAFDAEMSSVAGLAPRRRSSGAGSGAGSAPTPDERARNRAAMQAALAQGCSNAGAPRVSALALALEAAVHASGGLPVLTVISALKCNASLRTALLSGWLDPADAAAMTGRALMSSDFL